MTTATHTGAKSESALLSIVLVAFMGFGLFYASGLASASTLHDSAHDVRHSAGFPCH